MTDKNFIYTINLDIVNNIVNKKKYFILKKIVIIILLYLFCYVILPL